MSSIESRTASRRSSETFSVCLTESSRTVVNHVVPSALGARALALAQARNRSTAPPRFVSLRSNSRPRSMARYRPSCQRSAAVRSMNDPARTSANCGGASSTKRAERYRATESVRSVFSVLPGTGSMIGRNRVGEFLSSRSAISVTGSARTMSSGAESSAVAVPRISR